MNYIWGTNGKLKGVHYDSVSFENQKGKKNKIKIQ